MLRDGFGGGSSALATRGLSGDSKPRWRKCFMESFSWESSSLHYRRPTMRAGGLGGTRREKTAVPAIAFFRFVSWFPHQAANANR